MDGRRLDTGAADPAGDVAFVERTAARIIVAWRRSGLSFEDLCEETQISRTAMTRYIKGERTPNARSLAAVCTALGVSADWVLAIGEPPSGRVGIPRRVARDRRQAQ